MAKEVLGRVVCPECGWEHAEIKTTKAGLAYRWCPDCEAQYFPRTAETSARLLAKVGAKADPAPAPTPKPAPKAAPKPAPAAPVPEPAKPKAKPASPFDFLGV